VGVAIANFLPQVTLTGDLGSTATLLSDLFKPGTNFWSIGAGASETLFAGGTLVHRKRAADAALEQAASQYRSVVLTAFQNVADALHALDSDEQTLAAALRARDAAEKSLAVSRRRLELGSVGYLALLNAQQAYQQAVITWVQAEINRYIDTAALFQALGGAIAPVTAMQQVIPAA
jgi:outer membrane protein TolC